MAEVDDRSGNGFVLAELMIGGIQVRKIEPMERRNVGAGRLRVVERGRNEVVEVDGFDVERLLHMPAAVAQYLHHLALILDRIEMRLDRLRLGRNLAQRERRRKKLDQDGVHMDCDWDGGRPGSRDATITAIITI